MMQSATPPQRALQARQTALDARARHPQPDLESRREHGRAASRGGIGGVPGGSLPEMADIPVTAQSSAVRSSGASPESGVTTISSRVRPPGLHVVDGAAVCANLGVNPSLTIAAQAERAFSHCP